MSIEVRGIRKNFGKFRALDDVDLHVDTGELLALLGPSGSGKTTLLRIIAGLEVADAGSVLFHGEDVVDRHVRERQVGFVFQHYALFRHMTVFENVAFGLRVRRGKSKPLEGYIRARVQELLELVQLGWLANRYPSQLSGGQRQRVALARALAVEPRVLLLDEPFGALDAKVRKELRRWLRRLQADLKITTVFVTHDQEEALEVADRVVVMNEGHIEQIGAPDDVYDHPASRFVYNFLGDVNLFHGRVHQGKAQLGELHVEVPEHHETLDAAAVAYVRPHDVEVERNRNGHPAIEAKVRFVKALGPRVRLALERVDLGTEIEAELSRERYAQLELREGETVYVSLRKLRVFVEDEAARPASADPAPAISPRSGR